MPREDAAERNAIRKMYAKRGFPNVTLRYYASIAMYGISFPVPPGGPYHLETVYLSRHTVQQLVRPKDLQNLLAFSTRGRPRRRKHI